jgi:hypothetical protein
MLCDVRRFRYVLCKDSNEDSGRVFVKTVMKIRVGCEDSNEDSDKVFVRTVMKVQNH